MYRIWACLLAIGFVVFSASTALATYTPPPLQGAVNDTAGKLTPEDDAALEAKIADYRAASGNEIVVFVIGSLEGQSIEDVAYGAFNTWKIGKAGLDNGVLLVIAPNERKTRIETGKGVGDRLTDLQSSMILTNQVQPLLKAGKFRAAVEAGVTSIETILAGRELPRPPGGISPKAELFIKIVCGVFGALGVGLLIFTFVYFRGRKKRALAAGESEASYDARTRATSGSSSSSSSSSGGGGYSGGGGSSGGGGASGSY